uniref:Uncharacterized protein n=1 Tax=Pseudo-nitzschia australis TaxID=44445 RepID=A0A7S4AL28_9STRA
MYNNSLTGSIPSELERLANLKEIFAGGDGNNLTGGVVLHHLLYTTCVVCDEPSGATDARPPAAGATTTIATAGGYREANGSRCNELLARFQRHDKNLMTVSECDDLKEHCFVCG